MKTLSVLATALVSLSCLVSPVLAQKAPKAPKEQKEQKEQKDQKEPELMVRALCFQQDFPPEIHAHDPSGSVTAGLIEVKKRSNHALLFVAGSISF